jgi:condensin complex subunit 1
MSFQSYSFLIKKTWFKNRKSSSLASGTRKRLVGAICKACCSLASALQSAKDLVPESFRSALACHLYMLYNIMSIYESESKASNGSKATKSAVEEMQNSREACAVAMNTVTHIMAKYKSTLWKRGVADESIVTLPCRIAYQMMENATGVQARKLASGDLAIQMIASTLNSTDCLLNTVVSALVDMLHSYEHMAPLVAEICALVNDEPKNKLAFELLKEIGSLDGNAESDTSGKASGIKNVAPFLNCLAEKKPQFMLEHIDFVLPHLQAEPYNLRSAILTSIGHILIQCNLAEKEKEEDREGTEEEEEILENDSKTKKLSKTKEQLYQLLLEHVYDVSSYTRVAVLKTWATLIEARVLPVDKLAPITKIVIDRLQDKTVMVRRIAMQVCYNHACMISRFVGLFT